MINLVFKFGTDWREWVEEFCEVSDEKGSIYMY